MMEASPSSSLEMREAEFAFQLLLVAFDAPNQGALFREPGRVGRFWPNKANPLNMLKLRRHPCLTPPPRLKAR